MCFICVSDESDDDGDDEAALILELEQIRKERAEEKLRMVSLRGFSILYSLMMSHYAVESLGYVWALLVGVHELAVYNMVLGCYLLGGQKSLLFSGVILSNSLLRITESMGVLLFEKG